MKSFKKGKLSLLAIFVGILVIGSCSKDQLEPKQNETGYVQDEITPENNLGREKIAPIVPLSPPVLGEYWGGGYVAYILPPGEPGYSYDLIQGLIIGPYGVNRPWSISNLDYIGTSYGYGTGMVNTTSIVNYLGDGDYAAKFCYDFVSDGYNDWFLPSYEEYLRIYGNRGVLYYATNFQYVNHWTSSENLGKTNLARYINVSSGWHLSQLKNYNLRFRPVRYFTYIKPVSPLPVVSTDYPSSIGTTWATPEGDVFSDGGTTVTSRGFCWSTSDYPTILDSKLVVGSGTGHFIGTITGLTTGVRYYIRAFATNSAGTSYGNQIVVYPSDNPQL